MPLIEMMVAIIAVAVFSLFIPSCDGINPSSTITAINGSLVGPQCPGNIELQCIGVDLTSLSWSYSGLSPIHTFLFDSQPTSTTPQNPNPAFPMVKLLRVDQNVNPDFANFTSILTVDLTQLVQQNVTSITCGDPGTSDVFGVNISIIQPSVPPSPKLIEVTASYQSETLSSITAVWMKVKDTCNVTPNYKLRLNNSMETEVSQDSCEDQVCTGTLLNISGEGGLVLSLTTESSAGSSNATMYPNPIYQQSQEYFIPNVESSNCQVTASCISDLNSNITCTAQYSDGNQLSSTSTAPLGISFKLPITTFDINYIFQFSVLFDDILKIEILLEENIPSNLMSWMITEIFSMAVGLISCAISLILVVLSMVLLYTMANSKRKLRIFLIIILIIMMCCATALIIVFIVIAGIQPNTCDGQQLMTDVGLIVCLVISLVITFIVITVFCCSIILKRYIKRKEYKVSEKKEVELRSDVSFSITTGQSDGDSNQGVLSFQDSKMEDKSMANTSPQGASDLQGSKMEDESMAIASPQGASGFQGSKMEDKSMANTILQKAPVEQIISGFSLY